MGLLPVGIEQREGTIRLGGRNLVDVSTGTVKRTASEMTMIFQDPRSALNPTMRVGHQIGRVLQINREMKRGEATSTVWGDVPARDDRHGAGLQTADPDRR